MLLFPRTCCAHAADSWSESAGQALPAMIRLDPAASAARPHPTTFSLCGSRYSKGNPYPRARRVNAQNQCDDTRHTAADASPKRPIRAGVIEREVISSATPGVGAEEVCMRRPRSRMNGWFDGSVCREARRSLVWVPSTTPGKVCESVSRYGCGALGESSDQSSSGDETRADEPAPISHRHGRRNASAAALGD